MNLDFKADKQTLNFSFNVSDLVCNMTEEEMNDFIATFVQGKIMEEAMNRLTGSSDFWWDFDEDMRIDFLSKVEDEAIHASWSLLNDIRRKAEKMHYIDRLYWKMYHDEKHGEFFQEWLKENDFDCPYPKREEFKSVNEFMNFVKEKMEEFEKSIKKDESE